MANQDSKWIPQPLSGCDTLSLCIAALVMEDLFTSSIRYEKHYFPTEPTLSHRVCQTQYITGIHVEFDRMIHTLSFILRDCGPCGDEGIGSPRLIESLGCSSITLGKSVAQCKVSLERGGRIVRNSFPHRFVTDE